MLFFLFCVIFVTVTGKNSIILFRFEESKVLEAQDDNNAIVDSVHLGGAWNTAKIFPGFSQTKFCGCLLQVHYNNVRGRHFLIMTIK